MIGRYFKNQLIALDQAINALLGGDPDETISSRAGKSYPQIAQLINTLFFWQKNHVAESIEHDEGKSAVIK